MSLTTLQAAARLGITRGRVLQLIYRDQLAARKQGRDWIIPERAITDRLKLNPQAGRPKAGK